MRCALYYILNMRYQTSILALAAIFSSVQAHGVIESAIGEKGESKGFKGMFFQVLSKE